MRAAVLEAAREPFGYTYAITGIGAARMSLMIERIELSRPPGVSMRMIATVACLSFASFNALWLHFCVAGSIVAFSSIE